MLLRSRFISLLLLLLLPILVQATDVAGYLPQGTVFDEKTPVPSEVLGFEIGQRHPRHDQLNQYFYTLAAQSNRIKITEIGKTPQQRQQILVTISSPENLAELPELLTQRHLPRLSGHKKNKSSKVEPLVIWLGYSVHGDETSGANAAMVVAYYLAASQGKDIAEILKNTVIVLEPSINPDGMDRFVHWVQTYRGSSDNSDPNHAEHNQGWLSGRTNHFWFDLNRDWLLLTQQESRNRLKYFHQYQPNVLGDFHEMGANSTYFFQPGVTSRKHPLTPEKNVELTAELAKFHAKALDSEQRLYYSNEDFDDFYYGKGSTYPDINGSIGILFEQASSRGMQQQTVNGLLTFEYGIKNQVLTSLSTIKGAWKNKIKLENYRHNFYLQAEKQAKKEKFSGYLIHDSNDSYRLNAFLEKLQQHQIKVYPLTSDFRFEGKIFNKNRSYFIPIVQPQYRVLKALFNQLTDFKDNTFYDVSGWTLPLAMNIEFYRIERTWGLKTSTTPWYKTINKIDDINTSAYAYIFEWEEFLAPKMLNKLLSAGIKARVATKPFTSNINGEIHQFGLGSIVIPAGIQHKDNWRELLFKASQESTISLVSINTGLTPTGIDIGSRSLEPVTKPKVLLLGGSGISQYEAGEIRFYLDELLQIPVSVIDHENLVRVDISSYSHIILVDGQYDRLSSKVLSKFKRWLKNGGVIISQKRASKWLSDEEILAANFSTKNQINALFDTDNLRYQDQEKLAARKRIAGAIFETEIDTSHPLAYGYRKPILPMFRNSTIIMDKPDQAFMTVAQYSEEPLLSGYTDKILVNRLMHSAAIVAHNVEKGRVIATTDDLVFRGYWYGSAKILANSLFFAKIFSTPVQEND